MGSSMASAVLHSLWCVPVPGAVVCGVQGDAVVAAVDAANAVNTAGGVAGAVVFGVQGDPLDKTKWRVDPFWMLKSDKVRPSSS